MVSLYVSVVLKVWSLGLMVAAGSFWAGAGIKTRSKSKDEQTLIGGAIWSQIIIPIGLMISKTMGEELDLFVHGYFLITGIILLFVTGIILVTRECLVIAKQRRTAVEENTDRNHKVITRALKFDKIHFSIGIFCLIAGLFTLTDLILLMVDS